MYILIQTLHRILYRLLRAGMFRIWDAQTAHDKTLQLLRYCDDRRALQKLIQATHAAAFIPQPCSVGGVELPHPFMLAAGFVKGTGFANEAEAHAALARGENIIAGWQTMPHLVGAVEFGSFTRYPRLGNSGVVIWREVASYSTQNRVGLRNPGAAAAAAFLAQHPPPFFFGVNIALSPGLTQMEQEQEEVLEAFEMFLACRPTWFTLNLSCPNTEDDPQGNQTEAKAHHLCQALIPLVGDVPLWVKLSPDLSQTQYEKLMQVFARAGVKAVIATNTLKQPIPQTTLAGGVGGGRLLPDALRVVRLLAKIKQKNGLALDIIGCGGVRDQVTFKSFIDAGACAVQYYSGMIYAGPLMAASFRKDKA